MKLSAHAVDISGQHFGRLVALKPVRRDSRRRIVWLCRCECAAELEVVGTALRYGTTRSCGCLQRDTAAAGCGSHGLSRSRLYGIWRNMKQRCANPNASKYQLYGGRGISVCDEWQEFEPFMEWALSNGYRDDLTIDRIDSDGNYTPQNCRWATYSEQARNTSQNRLITYQGKTLTLIDWAERVGIKRNTLRQRLDRYGWSIEEALTIPVGGSR